MNKPPKKIKSFEIFKEDAMAMGSASATLGNTTGMGGVVTSQPSAIPGDAAGASMGSGDIGSGWAISKKNNSGGKITGGRKKRKTSRKKKSTKIKRETGTHLSNDLGKDRKEENWEVQKFSDFVKQK